MLFAQIALVYLAAGIATLCIFEYFGMIQRHIARHRSQINGDIDRNIAIICKLFKDPPSKEDLEELRSVGLKTIERKMRIRIVLLFPFYLVRFIISNHIL
jgi:hypothetical protein